MSHKCFIYVALVWAVNVVVWGMWVVLLYIGWQGFLEGEEAHKVSINVCNEVLTVLLRYERLFHCSYS